MIRALSFSHIYMKERESSNHINYTSDIRQQSANSQNANKNIVR